MANELDHVYFKNHIHRNLRASDDALGEASAHGLSLASNVQLGTTGAALKIFKLDSTGNLTTSNNFVLKGTGGAASNLVRVEGSFNVSNDAVITGSLALGRSGITTTNASSSYPNITPKVELKLGTTAASYTGGIVIRHSVTDTNAVDRNIFLFFKHSSEDSSGESAKFTGLMSRTNRSWANTPELAFISAGAERMFLSQEGLRIGYSGNQTTNGASSTDELQVNGSSFLSGVTTINGGGQAQALRLTSAADQVYMGFYPSGIASRQAYIGFGSTGSKQLTINNEVPTGSLAISVGGSNRIRITSGGNLGFGTDSPRGDLELGGSGNKTLRVGGIFRGTGTYTGLNEETTIHQIVFSSWRDVQTDTIGAKIVAINKTNYGSSPWDLVQSTDLAFFTLSTQASSTDNTAERMRIRHNGYIGINTNLPTSGLDVNADSLFRSGVTISGLTSLNNLTTTGDILGRSLDLSSTLNVDGRTDINNQFFVAHTNDQLAGFTGSGTTTGGLGIYYYKGNNTTPYIQSKTLLYLGGAQTGGLIYSTANSSASHFWHVGGFNTTSTERMRLNSNGLRINLATDLTANGAASTDELQVGGPTYLNNYLAVKAEGGLLKLVGSTHNYIEFYPTGTSGFPTGRSGYIGFSNPANRHLNIVNSETTGSIILQTSGTNRFSINSSGAVLVGDAFDVGSSFWANGTAQVIIGGTANTGFNTGTGAKLLITGYNNQDVLGESDIYPLYLQDENANTLALADFWVRAKQVVSPARNSVTYIGGDLGINTTTPSVRLDVKGDTVLQSGVTISGNTFLAIQSAAKVGINTTVPASGLDVNDNAVFRSGVTISGSLSLNTVTTTGAINANSLNVSGAASVTGALGVSGLVSLNTLTTTGIVNANILNVSGATTITGALSVSGTSNLDDMLVTGASIFRSGVTVSGLTSLNTLTTTGVVNANSLNVSGNASITGSLGVGGATLATTNSTGSFPNIIPEAEILGSNAAGTYDEALIIRHSNTDNTAVLRRLGLLFKHSTEASSGESNKMTGLLSETSSGFSNNPRLSFVSDGAKRMQIGASSVDIFLGLTVSGNATVTGTTTLRSAAYTLSTLDVGGDTRVTGTLVSTGYASLGSPSLPVRLSTFGSNLAVTVTGQRFSHIHDFTPQRHTDLNFPSVGIRSTKVNFIGSNSHMGENVVIFDAFGNVETGISITSTGIIGYRSLPLVNSTTNSAFNTGSIFNAYGFYAASPSGVTSKSGTATGQINSYGVYVDTQKPAGSVVSGGFGIYQAGSTDNNFFAGVSTFASGVTVSGLTSLNTLTTTGVVNASSLNVGGNTSLTGTLVVGSIATITGTLSVTGATTLRGNTTVLGTLGVSGLTSLNTLTTTGVVNASSLNVGGNTSLTGTLVVGSTATVTGTLSVTGATTLRGNTSMISGIISYPTTSALTSIYVGTDADPTFEYNGEVYVNFSRFGDWAMVNVGLADTSITDNSIHVVGLSKIVTLNISLLPVNPVAQHFSIIATLGSTNTHVIAKFSGGDKVLRFFKDINGNYFDSGTYFKWPNFNILVRLL